MYAQKYHLKLYANFLEPVEKVKAKHLDKKGQKLSKSKKFKILSEDKKDYRKITTFCLNKQKNTLLVYFLVFLA